MMGRDTGIAWARSTFNPWIGCTEVSPGCDHCYARVLDARYRYGGATHWGAGVPRHRTTEPTWPHPTSWNRKAAATGERWTVFPSLCDPFDNEVPEEWRRDFWDLIEQTPRLTWLLLTKRIGNVPRMLRTIDWAASPRWNVWIGASIVNQEEADRDLPRLLAVPAAKRFVSYEPALGPIDFAAWLYPDRARLTDSGPVEVKGQPTIDQIIVGGESRQGSALARPFDIEWARSTLRQCRAAGVAFFMKQTGSDYTALYERTQKDRAGADPAEWPEDLRVQEFPA